MYDPCDKPFLLVPCGDLDLCSTSRSTLLPGWGPQFFEFSCYGRVILEFPMQSNHTFLNFGVCSKFCNPGAYHLQELLITYTIMINKIFYLSAYQMCSARQKKSGTYIIHFLLDFLYARLQTGRILVW